MINMVRTNHPLMETSGKMALSGEVLSTLIFVAMTEADEAVAPQVTLPDGSTEIIDTNTPQKQRERKAASDAIAITIINYLIKNTEVIVPQHPSAVAMTGLSGPGPHVHSTNQPPISHKIGRIE